MTKTNSFDNRSVTFLQIYDDNTTIGPFVLVIVLICITYLMSSLKNADVINIDVMSEIHISLI
jgi:hypothetical protein